MAKEKKREKKAHSMKRLVILLLDIYRLFPLGFPKRCIYVPSCSEYARQAFERFSFRKALKLTCLRVLRCHPFSQGGFDPVE